MIPRGSSGRPLGHVADRQPVYVTNLGTETSTTYLKRGIKIPGGSSLWWIHGDAWGYRRNYVKSAADTWEAQLHAAKTFDQHYGNWISEDQINILAYKPYIFVAGPNEPTAAKIVKTLQESRRGDWVTLKGGHQGFSYCHDPLISLVQVPIGGYELRYGHQAVANVYFTSLDDPRQARIELLSQEVVRLNF